MTIHEAEAEISALIDEAGDIISEGREIETVDLPYATGQERKDLNREIRRLQDRLHSIEQTLLSLYGTLSLLQAEERITA